MGLYRTLAHDVSAGLALSSVLVDSPCLAGSTRLSPSRLGTEPLWGSCLISVFSRTGRPKWKRGSSL